MAHSGLQKQTRNSILHLHHLAYQQVAIAQGAAPIPNLCGDHLAFRQEVAAQAVSDLAGIDPVVRDRSQHYWMRDLHLCSMRKQMIVDPAREDACFHCHCPGLCKILHQYIQFVARCSDRSLSMDLTARILYAISDHVLVNI